MFRAEGPDTDQKRPVFVPYSLVPFFEVPAQSLLHLFVVIKYFCGSLKPFDGIYLVSTSCNLKFTISNDAETDVTEFANSFFARYIAINDRLTENRAQLQTWEALRK